MYVVYRWHSWGKKQRMLVVWGKSSLCFCWGKSWILSSGCSGLMKKPMPFGLLKHPLKTRLCIISLVTYFSLLVNFIIVNKVQNSDPCNEFCSKIYSIGWSNHIEMRFNCIWLVAHPSLWRISPSLQMIHKPSLFLCRTSQHEDIKSSSGSLFRYVAYKFI